MNRALARTITESLSVGDRSRRGLERLRAFRLPDWERSLGWLDDSGLALYLLDRSISAGMSDAIPDPIRTRLKGNLAANRQRLSEMVRELDSINRGFEAAGVEFAVLKGFSLAPDYCADASLRCQYDYDYLVRPESQPAAGLALQSFNFSRKIQSPGHEQEQVSMFDSQPLSFGAPDSDFYSPAIPRRVELHLALWEPGDEGMILDVPADMLDRTRLVTSQGLTFRALAEDDGLLFQILHTFHHILDFWCRPSCFLEIAKFIANRRLDSAFWECFVERIGTFPDLPEISGLAFAMAEVLFDARVPPSVAERLRGPRSAAISLWVKHYGVNWAIAPFPGSKLTLFVQREFMTDPAAWDQIWRRRLLPFHRPARAAEPQDETPAARRSARWDQWRFTLGRMNFHLRGLLGYARHRHGWAKLRRELDRRA